MKTLANTTWNHMTPLSMFAKSAGLPILVVTELTVIPTEERDGPRSCDSLLSRKFRGS